MRKRADIVLVERGIFPSRARAQAAIAAGLVRIDGAALRKPSEEIPDGAQIEAQSPHPYVSRGGVKLAAALDAFGLDPSALACLDVGASTGGFTDVLLRRGAKSVAAIDVGHGQFDRRLAVDPRVRALEGLDARMLTVDMIGAAPQAIVCDVSFISQRLVLPHVLSLAERPAWLVSLVKPQFEVGPADIVKGRVRSESALARACAEVRACVEAQGWTVLGLIPSPVLGGAGAKELLLGAAMAEAIETTDVVALDARGDGVTANGALVPGALPGERVRARQVGSLGELVEIIRASPERASPFCPWFGTCGGCAAQHMSEALAREWKRGAVVDALKRAGIEAEVGPPIDAHGAGRRRATFHARFPHGAPDEVGFMRARSHDIVSVDSCPLFAPQMAGAVGAARTLAGALRGLGKPLDIGVTATLDGLDVDLRGSGAIERAETRKLIGVAEALDLARVSNHGAIVIERRPPRVAFGEALVTLPPGGFLQATEAGEAKLATLAAEALADAKTVADLFCGAGAFALRLARNHQTLAMDSDAAAIRALGRGAASVQSLKPLRAETRDLFRRPLAADELARFDGALFDPPRAGAEAQARAFAESSLPLVVAISCNATTFARDARILIDGGFRIAWITPLDQFRYSPHVEIAALFRRPRTKSRVRRLLG
jgi:23S rRNA (uracil1939-C5)-methyltransferase